MIYVFGPRDRAPQGVRVINTTSKADPFERSFSPFHLGPVPLYGGRTARRHENGWQFAKLYAVHADANGEPTDAYWTWAERGWADPWAHRYPMGKGAKPLCSLWNGKRLGYLEARRQIYVPLYVHAVRQTPAFEVLQQMARKEDLALFDFDGYRADLLGMNLRDVLLEPRRPMGHAFVLKAMLDDNLEPFKKPCEI